MVSRKDVLRRWVFWTSLDLTEKGFVSAGAGLSGDEGRESSASGSSSSGSLAEEVGVLLLEVSLRGATFSSIWDILFFATETLLLP